MSSDRHAPPYRLAGAALLAIVAVGAVVFAKQYRVDFTPHAEKLKVVSARAGLVVDPGSKVTLSGVEIGRVTGLGRLATVQPNGTLQASPVGFTHDEGLGTIDIAG